MLIRPATPADAAEIDALLDAAFGPDRHARTASLLRAGATAIAGPTLVARCDDAAECPSAGPEELLGSIQFWPIALRTGRDHFSLALLGPVAVAHPARSLGLGRRLIARALAVADAMRLGPILLIGDASYYGRFGFTAAATGEWSLPGPFERERLLLRADGPLPRIADIVADSALARKGSMVSVDG